MHGVLVVDKPSGPTSFDVVARVRSLLGIKKVGHTGTLDPMATGVLPICLGDATKIAGFITENEKSYDAVLKLGLETDTLDAQGTVVARAPVPALTREQVEEALARFRGTYLQTPPMYSAVKVGGKKLYELAREGKEVERAPREVTVRALALKALSADEVAVSVTSSKGFFVRVLAQELGRALGTCAHLIALRRTRSGPFELAQAMTLEQVERAVADGTLPQHLVSMVDALRELPAVVVHEAEVEKVKHGVALGAGPARGRVRVMAPGGQLLAIAEAAQGRLKYMRVLA